MKVIGQWSSGSKLLMLGMWIESRALRLQTAPYWTPTTFYLEYTHVLRRSGKPQHFRATNVRELVRGALDSTHAYTVLPTMCSD